MIMMKLLNDDVCLFVVHQSYMIMINIWKHWVEYFQVLLSLGFFLKYISESTFDLLGTGQQMYLEEKEAKLDLILLNS